MKFKTPRILQEWGKLLFKNPALTHITLDAEWFNIAPLTITCIYRTEEEQRKLYPKDKTVKSVHQYWRGVDIRTSDLTVPQIERLRDYLNNRYPYGKKTQTCIYHNVGAGYHLHLQSP